MGTKTKNDDHHHDDEDEKEAPCALISSDMHPLAGCFKHTDCSDTEFLGCRLFF